jgi:integrase
MKTGFRVRKYKHPRLRFVVRGKVNGRWARKYFETKAEAQTYSEQKNIELLNQGREGIEFPSSLRVMAQDCQFRLQQRGKTINDATAHYLQHLDAIAKSCTVDALVAELLKVRKADGASARYLQDLTSRLKRFAKDFGARLVAEISTQEVDEWLRGLAVAPVTRNNFRRVLVVMFGFAIGRGYASHNAAAAAAKAKQIDSEVGILTVAQTAKLLESASAALVPFIAIGAFAGLRPEELARLSWDEIDLEANLIEVKARKSKTARRRHIKIQPNLAKWLTGHAKATGQVAPSNLRKKMKIARKEAGISDWPNNALRHGFASYHLAKFQDAAALALEMGHTDSDMLFAHYRQLVKPRDAARYWNIVPMSKSAKIVAFTKAA